MRRLSGRDRLLPIRGPRPRVRHRRHEVALRRERQLRPPAIYLSTHHVSSVDAYWRLYLIKYGRQDLLLHTVYLDSEGYDVESIPPGSLLLVGRDDRALAPAIEAGRLRTLTTVPEPGDPPFFSILVRAAAGATADRRGSFPAS